MERLIRLLLYLSTAFLLWHCNGGDPTKAGDKLLAEVYNKTLYLSDLDDNTLPEGTSREDSALIVSAYALCGLLAALSGAIVAADVQAGDAAPV